MYSVSLLDLSFACVFVIVALLMAYAFGYTHKMERLTKALASESCWSRLIEHQSHFFETAYVNRTAENEVALAAQYRELKKQHREAMKKYKARCDAKVVKQLTYLTN